MRQFFFVLFLILGACAPDRVYNYYTDGSGGQSGSGEGSATINNYYDITNVYDGSGEGSGEEVVEPLPWPIEPPFDAAEASGEGTLVEFDVFGVPGNIYWFSVTPEQADRMNQQTDPYFDDLYGVEDQIEGGPTYGDMIIMNPAGEAVNFGQVEVKLFGQSTFRFWYFDTIPNIRVDTDEFQEDLEVAGFEHFRFRNCQVGTIFAEAVSLAVYNALGYPAPRTQYAFIGGSPWQNAEVLVPYLLTESYKKDFCKGHPEFFGGGCENIWETQGADVTLDGVSLLASDCELSSCDNTHLQEFAVVVSEHYGTTNFKEPTSMYLDWDAFHEFQCIEWLLWIGDDYLHNQNNILLTEGDDGLFRFMPYSTDISAGMAWGGAYSNTPLYSEWGAIGMGCQYDPQCWSDTIDTCERVIGQMQALDVPNTVIDPIYNVLLETEVPYGEDGGNGMLRYGDEDRYAQIREFYSTRPMQALEELNSYRDPWPPLIEDVVEGSGEGSGEPLPEGSGEGSGG